jgi:hypothetical protein
MSRAASALAIALSAALLGGCVQVTRTTAPSASPGTTTVVVPPGSTVAVVQTTPPSCGGTYNPASGTNFGSCSGMR